ncbi:MAG TPA: TolC family protein [Acidobacteriaceae bacterium]|jgi:outer membrane protein TolC|nr:TolC family protein [Acidobacteriaceae bacterium]
MRRLRWKYWLAGWLPVVAVTAAAAQAPSLTLREAIERALSQNPKTAAAQADVAEADADAAMARAALLPRLNLTEDLSRGNDPVYVFGTKLRQQRFAQSDFSLDSLNRPTPTGDFVTRLSGQWMVFNWFETQQQIHAAELGAASATGMTQAVNQRVVFQVVQGYQAVLYAQRQLTVAGHEEQTARAVLRDVETRVKAGLAIGSDLLDAKVNLSAREQETIAAQGAVENGWAELEAAMGTPIEVHPELRPLEPKSYPEENLAEDIAAAIRARPDLRALERQTAARAQAAKAAKSDFFPQISAYGNWEMDRVTFAGNGGNNWVAGAQLNFDLLPLSKRAHLGQARAAQEKAAALERGQEQQIRLAVSRAFTDHRTSEQMAMTAQAAMDQSAESLRILRNRYAAGLATMTDLLRAEDELRQSQSNYWHAAYGNTVAYAELLYATGRLTPDSAETLQ